jgi:hypothetical protein
MELIELHDHPRFPATLRDLVTDALEALWAFGNSYRPVVASLSAALRAGGERPARVLDLCSGGGGPWRGLAPQLEKASGGPVAICLSDRYPNRKAFERAVGRDLGSGTRVEFAAEPVDALRVPAAMPGFRTIFSSFHHFGPAEARGVLLSAVASGRGIGVFEVARRGVRTMLVLCFTPFLVLLLTPWIRPFLWQRLLWTYVLPVVPFVIWFDGWVSCLRSYSETELREMVEEMAARPEAAGYRWETGEARTGLLPVTFLLGYPGSGAGSGMRSK